MSTGFFHELEKAARERQASDAKFRWDGGARVWLNALFLSVTYAALVKAALAFGAVAGGLCVMFFAWIGAELVSRAFRLALPSVVVLAGFVAGALLLGMGIIDPLVQELPEQKAEQAPTIDLRSSLAMGSTLMSTALVTGFFYWRFRTPLSVSIIVTLFYFGVFGVWFYLSPDTVEYWSRLTTLIFSIGALGLAIRFDLTDALRTTRRSDVAYWLYILAGFALPQAVLGDAGVAIATGSSLALWIPALLPILGIISLVMDRSVLCNMAVLSSGVSLAYSAWRNVESGPASPLWLLLTAIVLFGSTFYWQRLRIAIVPHLPLGRLTDKLPPIQPDATSAHS